MTVTLNFPVDYGQPAGTISLQGGDTSDPTGIALVYDGTNWRTPFTTYATSLSVGTTSGEVPATGEVSLAQLLSNELSITQTNSDTSVEEIEVGPLSITSTSNEEDLSTAWSAGRVGHGDPGGSAIGFAVTVDGTADGSKPAMYRSGTVGEPSAPPVAGDVFPDVTAGGAGLWVVDQDGTPTFLGASPSSLVNQIIAGSGISISPAGGTGDVTISATGGGGSFPDYTGSGDPNGVVTPAAAGNSYVDTANGGLWFNADGTDTGWYVSNLIASTDNPVGFYTNGSPAQLAAVCPAYGQIWLTDLTAYEPSGSENAARWIAVGTDGQQYFSVQTGPVGSGFVWTFGKSGTAALELPDAVEAGFAAASGLWSGSGDPNYTVTGNPGDYFFRSDTPTTANQRIYVCTGGTSWTGIL